MSNQLKRDIVISKLLRTTEQLEFHTNHTLIHGIYDNDGLEGVIICRDWDTEDGLNILIDRMSSYKLRCRFNSHRNSTSFIRWISNENLENLMKSIENQDFMLSKSLIISESFSI